MSDENEFSQGDDFEKLLNSFINSKVDDLEEDDETAVTAPAEKPEEPALSQQGQTENDAASDAFEKELAETFEQARTVIEDEEKKPELRSEESELAQAYINYRGSIDKICAAKSIPSLNWEFEIDFLYPNYKPSIGHLLATDLVAGWNVLREIYPDSVGGFNVSATDEEFLNFAETLRDQDLQLAVISYVEILIDMESCELTYQAKLLKYQEKHIKRMLYEEYLERKERQKRFVEAVKKKNFPIDAERLVSNYFRVSQKDVDGAFKALTTNPAIFAPIEFAKIKPRFFGLVKVTPKDGIRVNIEIGKFMKKVKV